ncbi:MAG TPA: nucleotidyltransferase family protein [Candidatus Acidoferrum sp.]|nr:nucleotidyltransferase family protein [Candidatus Acidoferrum sp.]
MRAMVLCAGYGTRLGDLTREIPKPMLPLRGRPILEYILAHLRSHHFDQVAVNLHFLPQAIHSHFGGGASLKIELTYAHEDRLLGTAGGIKNMEPFLSRSDPFLVQYGDVVTDQDFTAMLRFHRERGALATLLLHQRARSNSLVSLDARGQITGFLERPGEEARRGLSTNWVNSGICLCRPEIFASIPAQTPCDLPRDIFPKLIPSGRLFGFPLSGYRCAIDSPARLAEAAAALAQGRCRISLAP